MVLASPFMPHKQSQHHHEPGIPDDQHAIARQRRAAGVLQRLGQGTPHSRRQVLPHGDYPVSCVTSSASLKWRTLGTIATPHTTSSAPRPPVKAEASVFHSAATTPDSNCPSCGSPMVKMLFTAATRPRK